MRTKTALQPGLSSKKKISSEPFQLQRFEDSESTIVGVFYHLNIVGHIAFAHSFEIYI